MKTSLNNLAESRKKNELDNHNLQGIAGKILINRLKLCNSASQKTILKPSVNQIQQKDCLEQKQLQNCKSLNQKNFIGTFKHNFRQNWNNKNQTNSRIKQYHVEEGQLKKIGQDIKDQLKHAKQSWVDSNNRIISLEKLLEKKDLELFRLRKILQEKQKFIDMMKKEVSFWVEKENRDIFSYQNQIQQLSILLSNSNVQVIKYKQIMHEKLEQNDELKITNRKNSEEIQHLKRLYIRIKQRYQPENSSTQEQRKQQKHNVTKEKNDQKLQKADGKEKLIQSIENTVIFNQNKIEMIQMQLDSSAPFRNQDLKEKLQRLKQEAFQSKQILFWLKEK